MAALRFLKLANRVHRDTFDTAACDRVGRNVGSGLFVTTSFSHQHRRNNQRTTKNNWCAIDDMPHRLEFFLAVLQSAFEISKSKKGFKILFLEMSFEYCGFGAEFPQYVQLDKGVKACRVKF